MKKNLFILIVLVSLLSTIVGEGKLNAQSTVGTDFWVTFMPNIDYNARSLTLIATGNKNCTGTISNPYTSWSTTFSITPNQTTNIYIPENNAYNQTASDQIINTALHITTTDSISLYANNYENYSFDIANVLPTSALGSEYILQTYHCPATSYGSAVSIIAIEDNTTIDITLKCTSQNNKHFANKTYSIILNTGQCYQILSINSGDFSGSTITANDNKKIAVFAGNKGARVPDGYGYVDHIFEQMMPTSCWGKNFVVTNSKMRTKDRVRVTALNNNCQIKKNGNLLTTINAKQTYEFEITDSEPAIYLETSEPASVFLYLTGSTYGGKMGDPSMVIINPIEQRIDNVTFSSFQTEISEYHFVNIVTDSDNVKHMRLDDNNISSKFTAVPSKPEYSYARIEVEHGSHTISNVSRSEYSGFVAHIYGLGKDESYAYSVGSMAINLSSQLILNGLSTIDYPNGFDFCINDNDTINFDLKLNYTPTDVIWDFGDGSTGNGIPINHYYEEIGDYDVTCEVYKLENGENKLVSTLSTTVRINDVYNAVIFDTICEGKDYKLYGLNLENTIAGLYEHTSYLQTVSGCDSIFDIKLNVIKTYDEITIEGDEDILATTNLITGCYKYTTNITDENVQYTWEISNNEWKIIPNNNECIVCATTPDKGTLYVRAENSCGPVYDYIVLNADFIENQKNSKVTMYPNPAKDFINIQQNDISRINVYDSYGQLILRNDYNFDSQVTLDLSSLKNSIYIIEIITLEKTFVERINIVK